MPQVSPTGGLSLILHILVNASIFLYKKIIKILKISKNNRVSNIFKKLTNKNGEGTARRILSYTFVCLVFTFMFGNFIIITTKLYNLKDTIFTQKIESVIESKYSSNVINLVTEGNLNDDVYSQELVFIDNNSVQNNIEIQTGSLVDFMKKLGIVNTSFNNRAKLARFYGIVNDPSEYTGSLSQNQKIIAKIKEELNR